MGRPKNKGVDTEGGGGGLQEEEEEEKARPALDPVPHNPTLNNVRKAQEGEAVIDPAPAPAPAPAPRKRGRPRKVVPKVDESASLPPQESATIVTDAEIKKQKVESPFTTSCTPPIEHTLTSNRPSTRVPLRREGSRRKSEPRRAAD